MQHINNEYNSNANLHHYPLLPFEDGYDANIEDNDNGKENEDDYGFFEIDFDDVLSFVSVEEDPHPGTNHQPQPN